MGLNLSDIKSLSARYVVYTDEVSWIVTVWQDVL